MSKLTDVVHFRGEVVTLYATFKNLDATPESTGLGVINPTVKIEYVNNAGQVIDILPSTPMVPINRERFYYRWTVPNDAPLTAYWAIYSGVIEGAVANRTEELRVENAAILKECLLRYGRASVLFMPPKPFDWEHPALPRGEF